MNNIVIFDEFCPFLENIQLILFHFLSFSDGLVLS